MYSRILSNKKALWKGIGWDYDLIHGQPGANDVLCVPLTRSQITAILGATPTMAWATRWYNATEYDQDFIDAWVSDLDARLMSVCGGDMVDQTKLQLELMAIANLLRANSDPSTYAPDAPTTTFDGASDAEYDLRNAALCQAIRAYVYRLWRETSERYASVEGFTDEIPEWWAELPFPLVALTGGFALIQAAFGYAAVKTALQDDTARDYVICQMYNRLKGLPVSAQNFEDVFAGMPVSGYNSSVLIDVLAATAGRADNYALFQQALSDGYAAAQAGAPNDCCGPECGFDTYWDQTTDGGKVVLGTRVLGTGVRANVDNGSGGYEARVEYYLQEPCTADEFLLNFSNAGYSGSYDAYIRIRRASDGQWSPNSGEIPPNSNTWGPPASGWGEYFPWDAIRFRVVNYTTGTPALILKRTGVR